MSLPNLHTRYCQLCRCNIQVELFGRHIIELHMHDFRDWPGGLASLLQTFQESFSMSIVTTNDPADKQQMRAGKQLIYMLEQLILRQNP